MANHAYHIIANYAKSHYVNNGNSAVVPPATVEGSIPPLWARDSFQLTVDHYIDWSASAESADALDLGAAATSQLYLGILNSANDPEELGSAVTPVQVDGSTEYYRTVYTIPKDDIPLTLANETCILYGVTTLAASNQRRTWAQQVAVISEQGTSLATKYTKDVDVSVIDITTDTTLTAYPGLVVYAIDTTAGALDITPATDEDPQEIILMHVAGAANATFVGTVNGVAAGITLQPDEAAHLIYHDGAWINLNPITIML